jgi:hypothetical protein
MDGRCHYGDINRNEANCTLHRKPGLRRLPVDVRTEQDLSLLARFRQHHRLPASKAEDIVWCDHASYPKRRRKHDSQNSYQLLL